MEELHTKHPVSRKAPFTVPEGYFDQLQADILAAIPPATTATVVPLTLWQRLRRPLIGIAALLVVAFLSITIYLHTMVDSTYRDTIGAVPATTDPSYASDDEADYIMLDNEDIYLYLCEL